MSDQGTTKENLLDLLARWQAFSELQQNAFAFLASEAIATGEEFENSTNGAAQVLTRMGDGKSEIDQAQIQAETFSVVHRLQAADRSRQGLEQVASVLETFRRLEAELVQASGNHSPHPHVDGTIDAWIDQLCACVSLGDWRKRFSASLKGLDPGPRTPEPSPDLDDELF